MTRSITPGDLWAMARIGPPVASASGDVVLAPVTTYDQDTGEALTRLFDVHTSRYLTARPSATSPAMRPDGGAVAFLRKVDDRNQVHVLDLSGGEAACVTDLPLGARAVQWAPDGSRLIVLADVVAGADLAGTAAVVAARDDIRHSARATERNSYRHWDTWFTDDEVSHLFAVPPGGGSPLDLTPDLDAVFGLPASKDPAELFDVHPDGQSVVFCAAPRDHGDLPRPRYRLMLAAIDGSGFIELTPDNPGDDGEPRFTPDGEAVVFGAQRVLDFYSDPVRLTKLDLATRTQTGLCPDWSLSPSTWEIGPDGSVIAVAEERGRMVLFTVPADGGSPSVLARDASLTKPVVTGRGIYALRQSLSFPPEVVRLSEGSTEILTHLNQPVLGELSLGRVEEEEIVGADGDPVQVFVVYPPGFSSDRKWPLVHMIHGGPHGTFGDVWHFRWNAHVFAAPGYVVPLVNFHGSTSFGHDFTSSISGEWGDKPTRDVLAATDAFIERGFIDPDRMAITGGSYGGYLTTWLATRTDRFACAVAHAAVTNLGGMYASDWTVGLGRGAGAVPWEDPERVARWSPSHHYAAYTTPTLVIHGERDYRVPITQGLELYGVLKAKGVDARLIYYPDENHWILKMHNSLHWYGEIRDWLATYLD